MTNKWKELESLYEPWTPEEMSAEAEEIMAESEFLKLPEGKTQLRILPKRKGTKSRTPLIKTFQHYISLPGMAKAVSFNCPQQMARRPCKACRKANDLRATGNPADFEMAKQLGASKRVYSNVIVRSQPQRGPVIWAFGKGIHDDLVALGTTDGWGDYSQVTDEGYDIVIHRTGTGMSTRYKLTGSRDCTPLSDDVAQVRMWLEMLHDLDRFLFVPTDDQIDQMLGGAPAQFSSGSGPRRRQMRSRVQDDAVLTDGAIIDE